MGLVRVASVWIASLGLLGLTACAPSLKFLNTSSVHSDSDSPNLVTIPSNPTHLIAEPLVIGARIYFSPPDNDGGIPISRYFVYRSDQTLLGEGSQSPIEIRPLLDTNGYDFYIVAENAVGIGPPSDLSGAVWPYELNTVPDSPTITGFELIAGGVRIFYLPPDHLGEGPITDYQIEFKDQDGQISFFNTGNDSLTYDAFLDPLVAPYQFRVYAINSMGGMSWMPQMGPPSQWSERFIPLPQPPRAPGSLAIAQVTVGIRSASVSATIPVDDGGSPITSYRFRAVPSVGYAPVDVYSNKINDVLISGLVGGISYTFFVTAINAIGESPFSPPSGTYDIPNSQSLPSGRYRHASVVLSDGRILISGGLNSGGQVLSDAILFNPATGLIENSINMNFPRVDHSMVLLASGSVLVFGGSSLTNISGLLTQAEIYNPINKTFSPIASPMNQPRRGGAATLLSNGNVFICGGTNASGTIALAEYFIPGSFTFSSILSQMAVARSGHTATFIPGVNKVLVVGGSNNSGVLNTAELFDVNNETFSHAGVMSRSRVSHTATLLMSGKVLVAGGQTEFGSPTDKTEIFDPLNGPTFFDLNSPGLLMPRMNHTATLMSDGKVLIAGGEHSSNVLSSSYELYDPINQKNIVVAINQRPRTLDTASFVNGQIVFVGGVDSGLNAIHSNIEIYGFVSETFSPTLGAMNVARFGHTQTLLSSGRVLITGGITRDSGAFKVIDKTAEIYDPINRTFTPTNGEMTVARVGHAASLLPNGTVLITGGGTAEIFDPSSGTFTVTSSPMQRDRSFHTSTLLPDGRVLIVGGISNSNDSQTAEVYDPNSAQLFSSVGDMTVGRWGHSAVLQNGRVLISGRSLSWYDYYFGSDVPPTVVEVFNPLTDTFAVIAPNVFSSQHGRSQTTLLQDGRVFFPESNFSSIYSSVDPFIFDIISNSSFLTGHPLGFRMNHTVTELGNGDVVIVGGSDGAYPNVNMITGVKLYRPTSNEIRTPNSNLLVNRFGHQATLLMNGEVLITGGFGGFNYGESNPALRSAELYHP